MKWLLLLILILKKMPLGSDIKSRIHTAGFEPRQPGSGGTVLHPFVVVLLTVNCVNVMHLKGKERSSPSNSFLAREMSH